jgi:hypothetical protein
MEVRLPRFDIAGQHVDGHARVAIRGDRLDALVKEM